MVAVKTLRDGKEAYDALRVPEELPAAVREAVRHARCAERRDARLPWGRVAVCALASAVVVFLVTLNAVPALAQELYGMPVLGQMAPGVHILEVRGIGRGELCPGTYARH